MDVNTKLSFKILYLYPLTLFKIYNYDLSPEIEGKKRLLRTPVCFYVNIE